MHGFAAEKRLTSPRPTDPIYLLPWRPMRPAFVLGSMFFALSFASACGGGQSQAPPAAAPPSMPVARGEAPPDISPVPEPEGLVVVGRVARPDGVLKTVGGWARLPLPGGAELVRSVTDGAVADVVDLGQPVDGAVALRGTARDPRPLAAFSVAVRSFDSAKAKLSARHELTPGPNGSFWVHGIGKPEVPEGPAAEDEPEERDGDDALGCSLAHAANGARLVCGPKPGVDALAGYLTRNVARQQWSSDVHVEIRAAPLGESLAQLRALIPALGGSALGGVGPAVRELLEAGANDLIDLAGDTDKILLDAQLSELGADATVRVDYQRASSLFAKLATSSAARAQTVPAALWHLPAETDLASYSAGSDPQLYQRPLALLGNVVSELAEKEQMPEAERKVLRDLLVDRTLPLLTGDGVYAKGFDQAAVDKGVAAREAMNPDDLAGKSEADRALGAQVIGWHLLRVNEPIARVAPTLKGWAALWARPGFTKWARHQAASKMLVQVRTAPAPAGVTLPRDAVHLEITVPREELELAAAPGKGTTTLSGPRAIIKAANANASGKRMPRKPIFVHVLAVPDQGATWLGFGLDANLVAQKALASLSSAPDANTFGKTAAATQLRELGASGACFVTLRGLLVLTAMDHSGSGYAKLGSLANKGASPIVMAFTAQGPSPSAAAGTSVSTFKVPRAAIEDIVRLALSGH